jgi:hypothetical protein
MTVKEPQRYSVEFINESDNEGDACLFQLLDEPPPSCASLAWMAKTAAPTTRILFTWSEELYFYWCEEDLDSPGTASMVASQLWPADPNGLNQITFGADRGVYSFRDLAEGPNRGRLYIAQDASVPLDRVSVGIGMSGFGSHLITAQPNVQLAINPVFTYWIGFGNFIQGASIDVSAATECVPVIFPRGATSLTATLRRNNTWSIRPLRRTARGRKPPITPSGLKSQRPRGGV